ncbi:Protein FAM166B [Trichoplax sp. H2]|nr:Protein FAM166B [Trichoplax sp. H2]|eukprot:RDD40550.1 Protein FAM166B [Trichoplax sp. H2]
MVQQHIGKPLVGAQIPGYRGYRPNIKFHCGETYGKLTHHLYLEQKPSSQASNQLKLPKIDMNRKLSIPRGGDDIKLAQEMVPGYTGYVPGIKYHFGARYKDTAESSIRDHIIRKEENREIYSNLKQMTDMSSKFHQQSNSSFNSAQMALDNLVKNRNHGFLGGRRESMPPPIPGYSGHIPKKTDGGLGLRYTDMTKTVFEHPHYFPPIPSESVNQVPARPFSTTSKDANGIYSDAGMMPNYTGHIPKNRYKIGGTYGHLTRSTVKA